MLPGLAPLMTTNEVAALFRVAQRTVCLWAECGELPGFKIGKQWRFRRDTLARWLGTAETPNLLQQRSLPMRRPPAGRQKIPAHNPRFRLRWTQPQPLFVRPDWLKVNEAGFAVPHTMAGNAAS